MIRSAFFALVVTLLSQSELCSAAEGMWVFNNLPLDQIEKSYGFRPTPEWIVHVMHSSVRFSYGGSGSLVSADGLVLTNHHVASKAIDALGKKDGRDYYKEGFRAAKLEDEKNPNNGLEVEQLVNIEDVTARVRAAVKPKMNAEQANAARKAVIAAISKEAEAKTGYKCDVVTLYQGGQYHLYEFKVYTDVRLVFAPEKSIAFFGGDPDNFEFPRFDLDMSIMRVYENGKPAKIQHYLKLPKRALKEGNLIFVSGNPGTTQRLLTNDALRFVREIELPLRFNTLNRREVLVRSWGERNAQNHQRSEEELFGLQNSRKAIRGQIQGLQDPALVREVNEKEQTLRKEIAAKPALKSALTAFQKIEKSRKNYRSFVMPERVFETGLAFNSFLYGYAKTLLRVTEEKTKPNGQRLEEYADAKLKTLELKIFSDHPVYDDFEILKLGDSLGMMIELVQSLPSNLPNLAKYQKLVSDILAGKSPVERAAELVMGSKLKDPIERKRLYEGGKAAVQASDDSMIQLAKLVDPLARELRKRFEIEVREIERTAYADIAKARFSLYGTSVYPDATFSPRLAFGTVRSYTQEAQSIAPFTTMQGAFTHEKNHESVEPFRLPPSWHSAEGKVAGSTPFNFVSTADIIGGNSGSPAIDQDGSLAGLIFDGNIQSLVGAFVYDEKVNRAVAVDARAIIEAQKSIYKMDRILETFGK